MLPGKETTNSSCHRVEPQAKLPTNTVLRTLKPGEVKLVKRVLTEPVEYVANEFFCRSDAEQILMKSLEELGLGGPGRPSGNNDDSGVYRLESPESTVEMEQEPFLFRRLNYCRYRVALVVERCAGVRPNADAVREIIRWERAALETRSEIVRLNVPLVMAMVQRTRITGVDMTDLISDGNMALMRAVVRFDCARGYKFSTYACRSILKSFSRVASRATRHRGYFPMEFDPELEKSNYTADQRAETEEECVDELKSILDENAAHLSDVERAVIRARFALDRDQRGVQQRGADARTGWRAGRIDQGAGPANPELSPEQAAQRSGAFGPVAVRLRSGTNVAAAVRLSPPDE